MWRTTLLLLLMAPFGVWAQEKHKNVLLLIADDLGMQVGCYGDKVAKTPNLDALAQRGTRFANGIASVASCSPSRATILTGMPTHFCGQYGLAHATHNAHSFRNVQSIPRVLKANGYRTGVISKMHVQPPEVYPWDTEVNVNGRNGVAIGNAAKKFFSESTEKPFFLLVGFTDPHRGKDGFDSKLPLKGVPYTEFAPKDVPVPYHLPDQPEVREDLADYYSSVARLDYGIGAVLQALDEAKLTDNTLVIFLSDNGIPFPGAKTTLYDAGVHLPLIVRAPTQKQRGVVNQALVSWTDIAPTVMEWTGQKAPATMLGQSVLPILDKTDDPTRGVVYGSHQFHEITMYYPMRMVRTRTHKLILNLAHQLPYPSASDLYNSKTWQGVLTRKDTMLGQRTRKAFEQRPHEELFDLTNDPNELKNLVDAPEAGKVLAELRAKLKSWQEATKDPWLVKYQHE